MTPGKDGRTTAPHRPSHSPEPRRGAARLQAASGGQVTHSLGAAGRPPVPSPALRSTPPRPPAPPGAKAPPRPRSRPLAGAPPNSRPRPRWSHAPFQATPSTGKIHTPVLPGARYRVAFRSLELRARCPTSSSYLCLRWQGDKLPRTTFSSADTSTNPRVAALLRTHTPNPRPQQIR